MLHDRNVKTEYETGDIKFIKLKSEQQKSHTHPVQKSILDGRQRVIVIHDQNVDATMQITTLLRTLSEWQGILISATLGGNLEITPVLPETLWALPGSKTTLIFSDKHDDHDESFILQYSYFST